MTPDSPPPPPPRRASQIKWIVGVVLGGFLFGRGVLGVLGVLETRQPHVQIFLGGVAIAVSMLLRLHGRARSEDGG